MMQKGVPRIKMFSLFIWSRPEADILNVTTFKYSLHKLRKPHYIINANWFKTGLNIMFSYCTQFARNSQSVLIICRDNFNMFAVCANHHDQNCGEIRHTCCLLVNYDKVLNVLTLHCFDEIWYVSEEAKRSWRENSESLYKSLYWV